MGLVCYDESMHSKKTVIRKIFVGLGGGSTILLGLILIPTPAPEGWLIVFAGIALLSTEFSFAKLWLKRVKAFRLGLNHWIQRQPRIARIGISILGGFILISIAALGIWGVYVLTR